MSRRERIITDAENRNMLHRMKPKFHFSDEVKPIRLSQDDFTNDKHEEMNIIIDDIVVGFFFDKKVDEWKVYVMFEDIETFERYWFHVDIFVCENLMLEAGLTDEDIERLVEVKS